MNEMPSVEGSKYVPTPDDVTTLEDLAILTGKNVKFSKDGGKTWEYGLLRNASRNGEDPKPTRSFSEGLGFNIDFEVSSRGVPSTGALTEKDFRKGMIVREATAEEMKDRKISYAKL